MANPVELLTAVQAYKAAMEDFQASLKSVTEVVENSPGRNFLAPVLIGQVIDGIAARFMARVASGELCTLTMEHK